MVNNSVLFLCLLPIVGPPYGPPPPYMMQLMPMSPPGLTHFMGSVHGSNEMFSNTRTGIDPSIGSYQPIQELVGKHFSDT